MPETLQFSRAALIGPRVALCGAAVLSCMLGLAAPAGAASAGAKPARLPARLVTCTLGHATNFNPELQQTREDITFDTHHRLTLYLPAIGTRTTPPPDAIEAPEPVDPRTRVTEDPDGITADAPAGFDRVVDLWPERVELARATPVGSFKTILVSDYDPVRGTAQMFLGNAADLTSYDLKRVYMGECTVALNPAKKVAGKLATR